MKWTDTQDVAAALADAHPNVDPARVRFTDLMAMAMALDGFDDVETRCNEKILEAIQTAWLDEI